VVLQQVVVSELLVEEAEQVPVLALARVAVPVIKQQAVPVIKQQAALMRIVLQPE
jgi:hypothetical protein